MGKLTLAILEARIVSLEALVAKLSASPAPVAKAPKASPAPVAKAPVAKVAKVAKASTVAPAPKAPVALDSIEAILEAHKDTKVISTVVRTGVEHNTTLKNIKGVMEYQGAAEPEILAALKSALAGNVVTYKYKSWKLA